MANSLICKPFARLPGSTTSTCRQLIRGKPTPTHGTSKLIPPSPSHCPLPGTPGLLRTLIIFASEILSTTNSYDNFPRGAGKGKGRGGERTAMSGQTRPVSRQAKVPAGKLGKHLMWPGVLQVISLMMLHRRRRCGIILFGSAAVPYLPLSLCGPDSWW